MRNRLERANRLPELPALARIFETAFELPLHGPHHARQDAASLPQHGGVEQRHPSAGLAQKLVAGDETVLEEELAHRRRTQSHLRERCTDAEAYGVSLDEECAESRESTCAIRRGKDEEEVALGCVGYERLRT